MKIQVLVFLVIALILFTICSCANIRDSWTDLGNDYTYVVDGNLRWIQSQHALQDGIYPNVLNYKYDNQYILVLQEPVKKAYSLMLARALRTRYSLIMFKPEGILNTSSGKKFLKSHMWTDSSIHKRVAAEMRPNFEVSLEKLN